MGYDIVRRQPQITYGIPDEDCYHSLFAPWESAKFFPEFELVKNLTVCSRYSVWVVAQLLRQTRDVEGDIVELGVYKGGMALLINCIRVEFTAQKPLRLFDTFTGMPDTDPVLDRHKKGDFSDSSLEAVKTVFAGTSNVYFHAGMVEDMLRVSPIVKVSFVHIDLDIHSAVKAATEYLWPMLSPGGVMVFDDYGYPTCPGARKAVDDFFAELPEKPLLLPLGSCFVRKD
jgi:O-methyltransferase